MAHKYTNIGNDEINLLKESFRSVINKSEKIESTHFAFLQQAITDVKNLPNQPTQNTFISFEYNNQIFYISLSDYKIEFINYLEDYYQDENGNKSDFNTIKQFRFKYEINGYTDIVGNFDAFSALLLNALKNVSFTNIDISEEE